MIPIIKLHCYNYHEIPLCNTDNVGRIGQLSAAVQETPCNPYKQKQREKKKKKRKQKGKISCAYQNVVFYQVVRSKGMAYPDKK